MNVFASITPNSSPGVILFGPDGNVYVNLFYGGTINRYNGLTGADMGVFVPGLYFPGGLAFGPDGNLYTSLHYSQVVQRYDGASGAFAGDFVSSGLTGEIGNLLWVPVAQSIPAAPTVSFTGAPASAVYSATFNVSATTNASTTAAITASGSCVIAGNLVTMTSGTGTCSLTANWAADSSYTAAMLTQSTTATLATPTVKFTGAPASAVYQSQFSVSDTTNASTAAVITAGGACTIAGNTVTMTSGTGTCNLAAIWAADSNFLAGSATQFTTATKITPTISWAPPAAINQGTALSGTQLNATANVPGTLVYTPPSRGQSCRLVERRTLSVNFSPSDSTDYTSATKTVSIEVNVIGNLTVSSGQTYTFANGKISGNLTVSGGTLILNNSTIGGNLTMSGGSLVLTNNSKVQGNLQISGASMFSIGPGQINGNLVIQNIPGGLAQNQIYRAIVNGNLQYQNNGTAVLIGGLPSCAGNTVSNNLQVTGNTAATQVDSNTVGGSLQVQNNTAAMAVFFDTVSGNLQCSGNNSSLFTGGGDIAKQKQGQCAGF